MSSFIHWYWLCLHDAYVEWKRERDTESSQSIRPIKWTRAPGRIGRAVNHLVSFGNFPLIFWMNSVYSVFVSRQWQHVTHVTVLDYLIKVAVTTVMPSPSSSTWKTWIQEKQKNILPLKTQQFAELDTSFVEVSNWFPWKWLNWNRNFSINWRCFLWHSCIDSVWSERIYSEPDGVASIIAA